MLNRKHIVVVRKMNRYENSEKEMRRWIIASNIEVENWLGEKVFPFLSPPDYSIYKNGFLNSKIL
jgi:hypothetical protein